MSAYQASMLRTVSARYSAGECAVGHDLLAQRRLPHLRRIVLTEGDEELLVAGESILHGRRLAGEGSTVSVISGRDARHIGDVLGQRLLAIEGDIGEGLVGVILRREFRGGGLKMREVAGRPPVAHAALGVEHAAFGVEGVADLVSDDGPDGAVVGRRRSLRVEERWLENRGREVERVLQRQIHRVDRLRGHRPFLAVNRPAQSRDITVILEKVAAPDVAEDVIRLHFVSRVIAPCLRVADPDIQRVELGLGFRFGGRVHPGERFNPLPERGDDVGNHRLHLGLGLRVRNTAARRFVRRRRRETD